MDVENSPLALLGFFHLWSKLTFQLEYSLDSKQLRSLCIQDNTWLILWDAFLKSLNSQFHLNYLGITLMLLGLL